MVAELKALEVETFDSQYQLKMNALARSWVERRLVLFFGRTVIHLQRLPLQCQREWLNLLERPLQKKILVAANAQIRSTRQSLDLDNPRGVVFIGSNGDYSLRPADLAKLLARLLRKKTGSGERQYRNIDAFVLFSLRPVIRVPYFPKALFWVPVVRETNDIPLKAFLQDLERRWHRFLCEFLDEQLPRLTGDQGALELMEYPRQRP